MEIVKNFFAKLFGVLRAIAGLPLIFKWWSRLSEQIHMMISWEKYQNAEPRAKFFANIVAVYGVIIIFSLLFILFGFEVLGMSIGKFILWFLPFYSLFSCKSVGPQDNGVILFFGKPILDVNSGFCFVPLLVCRLIKKTKLVDQLEVPAESQLIWEGSGDPPVGSGMVAPLRITTGGIDAGTKSDDPLDGRLTLEPTAYVRYRIKSLRRFIQSVGSFEEARKQLYDTLVGAIAEEFSSRTPKTIITEIGIINASLEHRVKMLVEGNPESLDEDKRNGWGAEIEDVRLKKTDVSYTINKALAELAAGKISAEKIKIAATAEKFKLTEEGTGAAKAEQLLLEARAIGYKRLAEELNIKEGEVILLVETAKVALSNAQYSYIAGSSGIADLFNVIGALKEVTGKTKKGGGE
jgi:regulator of protease activity HflC (stomatin/prohibitin superfamily)